MPRKTIFITLIAIGACLLAGLAGGRLIRTAVESSRTVDLAARAETLGPEALTLGPSAVILGNPDGDVTVIEYFDYQCPVCRRVHPAVQALVAEDPGIRMIHKHWPVFGDRSVYASSVALAAQWQGKYAAVHDGLMRAKGTLDAEMVRGIAAKAGVDLARLDRDLEARASEIETAIADASMQARLIGMQGTPTFLIGRYLVPGGIDLGSLRQIVADVRAGKDEMPDEP